MAAGFVLKTGDRIGIVATARWAENEDLDQADELIRSWGLIPVFGKSIGLRENQFAGSDEQRAADLQSFLDDHSICAVLCARGGYGTIRIIDRLDFSKFMEHPKWICGYSDITVLHIHISDKLGLPALHSTMPVSFSKNTEESLTTLRDSLFGNYPAYNIAPHRLNITGITRGEIIGGNLSILYSLLGTKYGFNTAGKILFIEDVDEYLYHIERMMMSMKLAGKFDAIKGVIVGGLNDMKDNAIPFGCSAEEIVSGYFKERNIPVCFGFPAGHLNDNRSLIFKKPVELIVGDKQATLKYI